MTELYTANELAGLLHMHPETIRKLGRQGKLKRVKVGTAVRFPMPTEEGVNDVQKKKT